MKRLYVFLSGLFLIGSSLTFPQATPPGGFVKLPDTVNCSFHDVMQAGGSSTNGAWVLQSIGSMSCKSANGKSAQDVPLVSGNLNNGMLATRTFGEFYIAGGGSSFKLYIRSEQLQPFEQFLDAAPPPPPAQTASGAKFKVGQVFKVTNKQDLQLLKQMEGSTLSDTTLPSGKLVPAPPQGMVWRVHRGKIVLEEDKEENK